MSASKLAETFCSTQCRGFKADPFLGHVCLAQVLLRSPEGSPTTLRAQCSVPQATTVPCCRELQRNGIDVVYCGDQEADSFLVSEAKAMMALEKAREVT